MKNKIKPWQKVVYYSGLTSFLTAIACLVYLYFKGDDMGWKSTLSASIMASSFFFASVGVVLITIGKSNLPSLKVNNSDS